MRFLSYPDLESEKGIRWAQDHLRRLSKDGKFPKPVRLGSKTVGWLETEIDAWIEARLGFVPR